MSRASVATARMMRLAAAGDGDDEEAGGRGQQKGGRGKERWATERMTMQAAVSDDKENEIGFGQW